jgi:hypothetical protein
VKTEGQEYDCHGSASNGGWAQQQHTWSPQGWTQASQLHSEPQQWQQTWNGQGDATHTLVKAEGREFDSAMGVPPCEWAQQPAAWPANGMMQAPLGEFQQKAASVRHRMEQMGLTVDSQHHREQARPTGRPVAQSHHDGTWLDPGLAPVCQEEKRVLEPGSLEDQVLRWLEYVYEAGHHDLDLDIDDQGWIHLVSLAAAHRQTRRDLTSRPKNSGLCSRSATLTTSWSCGTTPFA